MYAYISGKIGLLEPALAVLEVSGLGYEIRISLNTFSAIKSASQAKLYTYLHVKEDALTLYGFIDYKEKDTFLSLISISGVGPGTALMILSSLTAKELQQAIVNEEVKKIQSVKGIGAKTAQRIILELKDKILKSGIVDKDISIASVSRNTIRSEALSALTTLGINKAVAEKTIDSILKKANGEISLEDLIKQALKTA
ncbi:MAG: Holliday junction branch migration protein RuvA [Candidatus Cyclobacteriaceae bacterium M3_2C_046]